MSKAFLIAIASILILLPACGKADKSPVAIEINGIKITVKEFEDEYNDSFYAKSGLTSSRKDFLENLIIRKVILREAERQKLDREDEFLKDVELFWQQSLLKLLLDKEGRKVALDIKVDDKEVRDYYATYKERDFPDKELSEVYNQIRWLILREKQEGALRNWVDSLKKKARIKVDHRLLNIDER